VEIGAFAAEQRLHIPGAIGFAITKIVNVARGVSSFRATLGGLGERPIADLFRGAAFWRNLFRGHGEVSTGGATEAPS
jgi:hypothetical protein